MTTTSTHEEWAIRVRSLDHVLRITHITEALGEAKDALGWWQSHHPEVRPELICREVVVQRGDWYSLAPSEPAADHHARLADGTEEG